MSNKGPSPPGRDCDDDLARARLIHHSTEDDDPASSLLVPFPFAPEPDEHPNDGEGVGTSSVPASPNVDMVGAIKAERNDNGDRPEFSPLAAGAGGGDGAVSKPSPEESGDEQGEDSKPKAAAKCIATKASTKAPKPTSTPKKKGRGRPPGSKNKSTPKALKWKDIADEDGFTPVHRDPSPPPEKPASAKKAKGKAGHKDAAEGGQDEEDAEGNIKGPPKRTKHKQLVTEDGRCRRCLDGPKFKKGHSRTCPKSVHYGAPIPPDSSSSEESGSAWETDTDASDAEEKEEIGAGEADAEKASSARRITPRREVSVAAARRDLERELERRLKRKARQRKKEGNDEDDDGIDGRDYEDIMKEIEALARPSGVEGLEEVLGCGSKKRKWVEGEDGTPKKMRRKKKRKKSRRKKRGSGEGGVNPEDDPNRRLSPLEEYKKVERDREEAVRAAEEAKREMEEAVSRYEAAKNRITELEQLMKAKENSVIDARLGDDSEWSRMYANLQAFKDVHGHILFPLNCYKSEDSEPELRELFKWVMKQRKTSRHMPAWRKSALDRLGFNYDTHDATWEARYLELSEFVRNNGSCVVQHNHVDNPQLGQWVSTQRRMRRNLGEEGKGPKTCVLTEERVARLDALGFVWDAPSTAWADRFKELLAYKSETGSFNVPSPHPRNPPLQRWVQTQRTHYRYYREGNPKCQLTADRIQMLDDVGFPWRQRPDWRSSYDRLVRYKAEYGTSVVSEGYDKSLAKWTRNQRTEYRLMLQGRKNKLKTDHVRLLDEIGFDWIPPTKR
mmetsp:Transcript_58128/g.173484  ORF Transcript_58128/g.173484 Transcript_58128/m.173484 type:complete len:785 (-) Transcript_58128:195-2549(-)